MEQERSIDRLTRYLIIAATLAILAYLCWYFKSVLVYIIGAFVVSLIGQPVMRLLRKIRIRGKGIHPEKSSAQPGDLYVTVQVQVPKDLTDAEIRKLRTQQNRHAI